MKPFILILAAIWGGIWAAVLQRTDLGRFLVARRTWLTVVVGLGGDLILLRPLLTLRDWLKVIGLITLSSGGIIARSIHNEWREHRAYLAFQRDARSR